MDLQSSSHVLAGILSKLQFDDIAALIFVAILSVSYLSHGILWDKPEPGTHLFYVSPQDTTALPKKDAGARNIVEKMNQLNKEVVVFWGSQSGKSQRFANGLARECHARYGINAMAADLDDYDHKHISSFPAEKLMVFIVATYGEGDPTDNANTFSDYLEGLRRSKSQNLNNVRFLACGLGNSTYRLYNRFVDVVDERLRSAGAQRLGYIGKADAAETTTVHDGTLGDWKIEALRILGQTLRREERPMVYEPGLDVVPSCHLEASDVYLGEPSAQHLTGNPITRINQHNPYAAPIAVSKELFATGTRNCIHMEFDISGVPSLKYQCGDHLAVWPVNPEGEVERLAKALGWDVDAREARIEIQAKEQSTKVPLPTPTTRETLIKYYLEICGPVSRDLIGLLTEFAPSERGKQVLNELYKDWSTKGESLSMKYLNLGKLIQLAEPTLPWTKVPLSLLIESISNLQPRYYSIASSPTVAARKPAITAIVASPPPPTSDPAAERFHGVATNYLLAHKRQQHRERQPASLGGLPTYDLDGPRGKLADSKVLIHIRSSAFKLPNNPLRPIIMVGAGTGIAPFRGFLQERTKIVSAGKEVGQMLLFFGCRNNTEDFLYKDEWSKFKETGAPFEMVTAFSRETKHKTYVQHRLTERKQEVISLLDDEDAFFYICGSARMALEVRKALVKALMECKSLSADDAEEYVRNLKVAKRFQEDVWANQ